MNILLILLGCSIFRLLENRIKTAVVFADKFNGTNIDWFLSGGIKNPNEDTITEAEKMILETIFLWLGGLFCILLVLTGITYLISFIYNNWLKHSGIFWRCIYLSIVLSRNKKDKRYLNKIFTDKDGAKFKIVELLEEIK